MRILFFVWVVTFVFSGCAPSSNQAGVTSPTTNRMKIVDGPLVIRDKHIYIIKDGNSEKEFLVTIGSATAVTPIP